MYLRSMHVKNRRDNRVDPTRTIFKRTSVVTEQANRLSSTDRQEHAPQNLISVGNLQPDGKLGLDLHTIQCARKEETLGTQPKLTDPINVPTKGEYSVSVEPSTFNHGGSDIQSVRKAMAMALAQVAYGGKAVTDQGEGNYRVKINDGNGYIALNISGKSARFFHYHWNYALDN
jgi:hypothetical protein